MSAQAVEELALPRVSDRHRNKALASARKAKAIALKAQGWTYQQIADAMGYRNKDTVYAIIKQAQSKQLAEGVQYHRDIELARLNSLQAALWDTAMAGDVSAAHECLKLIIARCRLLGLYEERKSPKDSWDNCQGPSTVIARADDCRHEGCDKHGRF